MLPFPFPILKYDGFSYRMVWPIPPELPEQLEIRDRKLYAEAGTIPPDWTGTLEAKQIYVDELSDGQGATHPQISRFVFRKGVLSETDSRIQQDRTRYIEQFIWTDQISERLSQDPSGSPSTRRLFYVSPTGTVRQNQLLIGLVTEYLVSGRMNDTVLTTVLAAAQPVLRSEIMGETEPGSGVFQRKVYDLAEAIRKKGELHLLERLPNP